MLYVVCTRIASLLPMTLTILRVGLLCMVDIVESLLTVSQSAFSPRLPSFFHVIHHFLEEACFGRLCVCSSSRVDLVLVRQPAPHDFNNLDGGSLMHGQFLVLYFPASGGCVYVVVVV